MNKYLLILMALASLTIANYSAQAAIDSTLDDPQHPPYASTIEAIGWAVGNPLLLGDGLAVTGGPWPEQYQGQTSYMVKVVFHLKGETDRHCAIIHEIPGFGPKRILGCEIDY